MVLDNSRVHHAKILQEFLRQNTRLRFLFLPPYSPNLNAVEELWKWLEETCVNNVFVSKYYQINRID